MITEFANNADLDKVAHTELPHPDLHSFSLRSFNSQYDTDWMRRFPKCEGGDSVICLIFWNLRC